MKTKFNEEFVDQYKGQLLPSDLESKAQVELTPEYAGMMKSSKDRLDSMKKEFEAQDKAVKEFLEANDLEENPKLPKMENEKPLKDMKLKESLKEGVDLKEDLDPNSIHDFIDANVPMEDLGLMAYKWLTSDELVAMLEANGWDDLSDMLEEQASLKEETVETMIDAFKDKIDELEGTNESLKEDVPLDDLYDKYEEVMDKLDADDSLEESIQDKSEKVDNSNFNVPLQEDANKLTEDYSSYIGRPLKDFLDSISDKDSVILDHKEPAHGVSGFNGRVNQIPWYVADRIVRDIQLGDGDHYKFKIITEAFNDERKQNKRYKVVVADENSRPLKVKDVSGVGKVNKELEKLTNDVLADMKATQVYVTNEDNKEIYVKFVNDDGSWDIIQNDIDLENEVEDRDTLFNHIMADLSSESSYFVGDLRNMSRKGEGYVGFDDQEIGFNNDTFYLTSVNDKQINWAKKVADYYGLQTSAVKENNGRKYIEIYAPGISDDPKLIP